MNERGDTLEFVGDAEIGLASGTGGMIIQRNGQLGATYYEGEFKKGLPDGVVRVERPGELPGLRQYRAGTDIGKGNPASLKSLSFASLATLPSP